jgi:hypothetical protein
MKKYILIASIAIIAVLNFTLVKSKTGEVTLKSVTELAQANACENDPNHPNYETCETIEKICHYGSIYAQGCVISCGYIRRFQNVEYEVYYRETEYCWDYNSYIPTYVHLIGPSYYNGVIQLVKCPIHDN